MKRWSTAPQTLSRVALIGVCGLMSSGCSTKITALSHPHSGNSQGVVHKTGVDIDSQGGVDDVQEHITASGFRVLNVSVGGGPEKIQATSASATVSGGIYVQ